MSRALGAALIGLLGALPAPARAQVAQVGVEPGPGGVVMGRVCADVDGDGRCGAADPGIGGARVRFEDGRIVTTDEDGRFHVGDLDARITLGDRAAYGAHAVSVDGLAGARRFELGIRGAAGLEFPVELPGVPADSRPTTVARGGGARLRSGRVVWTVAGSSAPGARVRVGGAESVADVEGRWSIEIELADGENDLGLTVAAEGEASLWALRVTVLRPGEGSIRVYPEPPRRVATLAVREAATGTLLAGQVAPGMEVALEGRPLRTSHEGRIAAWAPSGTGPLRIAARGDGVDVEGTMESRVRGARIDGLLLGELELQLGGSAGLLASGRLAGSASGRWRGLRIDAGVDLDDRDRRLAALAAPRDAQALRSAGDPLRSWLLPGDRASVEDLDPRRGRVWARAEGEGLSLALGDVHAALGQGELGRVERALFGGRVDAERDVGPLRLGATVAGARPGLDAAGLGAGAPAQDLLLATGGSVYYLSHREVVAGSEVVRIEWRDPDTRLTVRTRVLSRDKDYALDAAGGTLWLAHPVSSRVPGQAVLAGEPFAAAETWLRVEYLHAGAPGDTPSGFGGGELRAAVGPFSLAAGGATETREGGDWTLWSGRAALDLGAPLKARLELSQSRGLAFGGSALGRTTSMDGGFVQAGAPPLVGGTARAVHANVEGAAGGARWHAWWREREAGYSDGRFEEPIAARERGARVEGDWSGVGVKVGWADRRGADLADPQGAAPRDEARASGSVSFPTGPVHLTVDALHQRVTLPATGRQTAAGVRVEWPIASALALEAGHLQAFGTSGDIVPSTFTSVGASLRAKEGWMGLRAGWGPSLGPRLLLSGEQANGREAIYGTLSTAPRDGATVEAGGSALGGRQAVGGATLFTEERVAQDTLGVTSGRVVGARLEPAPGLGLSLSAERGDRLRLDGSTAARGAAALGASWSRGPFRADGRGELRTEGQGSQRVGVAGAEWSVASPVTLALRVLLADGELDGRRADGWQCWLSAAWRAERLSALARIGRLRDDRPGIVDRDAALAALAVTAQLARWGSVGLGLEGARQWVDGIRDDRVAGSVRGILPVAGPWDLALEYARRGSLDGRTLGDLDALRAEAGLTAGEARFALGYTLVGFRGSGIDPQEERDGRLYLRAVVAH